MSDSPSFRPYRLLAWFVLLVGFYELERRRYELNARALADGHAAARRVQDTALRLWAEEDLRALQRRCRRWAIALSVAGVLALPGQLLWRAFHGG